MNFAFSFSDRKSKKEEELQELREFLAYNQYYEPQAGGGGKNSSNNNQTAAVENGQQKRRGKKSVTGKNDGKGPNVPKLEAWGPAQDPWAFEARQFQ